MSTLKKYGISDDDYLYYIEQNLTAAELVGKLEIHVADLLANDEWLYAQVFGPRLVGKLAPEITRLNRS